MNLQIHHVISDITGATGMAIIAAILKGERDPEKLAEFKGREDPCEPGDNRARLGRRLPG